MEKRRALFLLSLFACLIPYLILCFYIHPSGDDYSYAWVGQHSENFLDTLIGEWNTWNGRYVSNIFVLINPIAYGHFGIYQMIPSLLLMGFIVAQSFLIGKFWQSSRIETFVISLCLLLVYLNVMPDIGEGIFWYTAAVTYFAPLLLFPLHLLLLNNFYEKRHTYLPILIIALQILLTGFNEIMMIIMTLLHLSLMARNRRDKSFWLFMVAQLILSAIVYYAPGNEVRSSYFPNKHDLIHTLFNGSANTLRFSASLLFTPSLWICLLLFVKSAFKSRHDSSSIWLWVGLFLLPQFIACAGPVWTTGIIGQHRTPNFALYFQILVIFLFITYNPNHKITAALRYLTKLTTYPKLIIALVISFLLFGNGYTAIKDLISGDSKAFHQENIIRIEQLQSLKEYQDTVVVINKFRHRPKSIYIYDVSENPNHWKNEAYTIYYGLKQKNISIRVEPH